jgi:hypothetical protein
MAQRTVNEDNQVTTRRQSATIKWDTNRHYVKVQKPDEVQGNASWDGPQFDDLMDQVDPETGQDAYRIEVDGAEGTEQRRMAGKRNLVILSCPKSYIDKQTRLNSQVSYERSRAKLNTKGTNTENIQEEPEISIPSGGALLR